MFNLGPNTRLGNSILALTLVATPFISYLFSLIISSLLIRLPFFSGADRLEWIIDITVGLTPLLFLPVSLIFYLAAAKVEDMVSQKKQANSLIFLIALPVGFMISWYLARYLSNVTAPLLHEPATLLQNLYIALNVLTFIPVGIALFSFIQDMLLSKD